MIITDQIRYNITAGTQALGREHPYVQYDDLIFTDNPYVPYLVTVVPSLGLSSKSDIVELYLEPSLGFAMKNYDVKDTKKATYYLAWNAYGEIYIRPIQNLEFYFEVEVGNNNENNTFTQEVQFNTTTGITWYLPKF